MMNSSIGMTRVYITDTIFTVLCPEGQALRDDWLAAVDARIAPDVIYELMKAYFIHRNGTPASNGRPAVKGCMVCSQWYQDGPA